MLKNIQVTCNGIYRKFHYLKTSLNLSKSQYDSIVISFNEKRVLLEIRILKD